MAQQPEYTITVKALADQVSADAALDKDVLVMCIEDANVIVQRIIADAPAPVPAPMTRRATLEAAADLYMRKNSRTGVPSFDSDYGVPAPLPVLRDPTKSAEVILRPWLSLPIG